MTGLVYYQQGDVVLKRVNKLPTKLLPLACGGILQHGEVTGHAHRFVDTNAVQLQFFGVGAQDQRRFVTLKYDAPLSHEEHNTIQIPAGDYELVIVREYDHFSEEARAVVD